MSQPGLVGARVINIMLGAGAGGLEAMARNTHRVLGAQGAEVCSVGADGGWLARAFADDPGFVGLSRWARSQPLAGAGLRKRLGGAPDLVLAHGVRAVKLAKAAFLGRAPVVGVVHNFRGRTELASLDLAVCVSAAIERDVKARYPDLATTVVENFAELTAPKVRPPHEGPPRIVTLGRLHANKGFGVLLAAAALARDRGLEFELTIAGDGPERAALTMEAEVLRLNDRVRFHGWVDDAAGLLAGADLFVLPSIVEPFGLVLIEAMAAGAPVVASDIDGPHDILQAGRLGTLVAPDNPEALAEAIIATLADPEGAAAVARLAQAEVLARYSLEAGGARLAAALLPLIRRRAG